LPRRLTGEAHCSGCSTWLLSPVSTSRALASSRASFAAYIASASECGCRLHQGAFFHRSPSFSCVETHFSSFRPTSLASRPPLFLPQMNRTIVIRREYLHFITKYQRYERRHKNVSAHCSPAFRVEVGDNVTVGQCRPLSKTVRCVSLSSLFSKVSCWSRHESVD
jgi:ribosomal protein S17